MLQLSLGFRDPFLERDLNQYCYVQAGSSTAYCTTAAAHHDQYGRHRVIQRQLDPLCARPAMW